MPFQQPTLATLATRIESDLVSRLNLSGQPLRRSVVAVMARVLAGAAHGLHGHLAYLTRQILPDTADVEFLERHATLFGLSRTPATFAVGDVTFAGTDGSLIPAGTSVLRSDSVEYQTDDDATIAAGEATVAVTAVLAGEAGNAAEGVALLLVSPSPGVSSGVVVATGGLTGGLDVESDTSLRARLIDRMSSPPQGGAAADYVAWAKAVSGVTRAWVYPIELGAGTVTVRFVRDDDGAGAAIIPSGGEVAVVQAYIDVRRPVTADVTVVAPVSVPLAFTIHIVPDTAALRTAVTAELVDLLRRDGEPGQPVLLSQIRVAVGAAPGVEDFVVSSPSGNVTHTTGQIPTMGTVTWT